MTTEPATRHPLPVSLIPRTYDLLVARRIPRGPLRSVPYLLGDQIDEPDDARLLLRIDPVRLIVRPVIIRMRAVEEEQDRHALPREVVVVRAEEEVLFRPEVVD